MNLLWLAILGLAGTVFVLSQRKGWSIKPLDRPIEFDVPLAIRGGAIGRGPGGYFKIAFGTKIRQAVRVIFEAPNLLAPGITTFEATTEVLAPGFYEFEAPLGAAVLQPPLTITVSGLTTGTDVYCEEA